MAVQKQTYRPNVGTVAGALALLDWMPGYPSDQRKQQMIAMAVCQFADDRPHDHEDLGPNLKPLDWLIREATARFVYFPKPIQLRRLYEQRWTPLDGQKSVDMGEVLE